MKRQIQKLILFCLALALAGASTAQDGGQICVMSYEDRNGNGSFDEDELPITQGIAVNLQNALGITIATKSLEASTYTVPGLLCLEDLPRGEYQALLTSAQYQATTDSAFSALVVPGSTPVRFDFGVRLLPIAAAEETESPRNQLTDEQLQSLRSIGIGLIAIMLISLVLLLIGGFIYMRVSRRRLKRLRARQLAQPPNPPADAAARPVEAAPAPQQFEPGQGSPLLFADDDTSPNPVA